MLKKNNATVPYVIINTGENYDKPLTYKQLFRPSMHRSNDLLATKVELAHESAKPKKKQNQGHIYANNKVSLTR